MNKSKQFWDNKAGKFDHLDMNADKENKELIELTKKYLNPDDIALDYGSATGTKTIALADSVHFIYGLDISSEMIRIANEKAHQKKIENINFVQGTIFQNDFTDEHFDVIVSYSVLHLLKNINTILEKIHALLKTGGRFISVTACFKEKITFRSKLNVWKFLLFKYLGIMPLHLNLFTIPELEKKIKDAGFKIAVNNKVDHGFKFCFIVAEKI